MILIKLLTTVAIAGSLFTTAAGSSPKTIIVGTGSAYKNVCFLDENNILTGFEIDALKKVNELLPQYKFEFKILDFKEILISLETGKIDFAAHQFESNPDRRAKFLFADEGVTRYDQRIIVKESRNDINSLDDLAALGATVQVGNASSNNTYLINKWNEEHGSKLKTVLAPSDPTITIQNIENGKIDAFIHIERTAESYKKSYNAKIKVVGKPINFSNAFYLYRKDDQQSAQLKKDIDGAVRKLKENGTLKELSIKWLGADYIPEVGK